MKKKRFISAISKLKWYYTLYAVEKVIGRTTLNASKFWDFGSEKIKIVVTQRDGEMFYGDDETPVKPKV
ncbi:hypothetical protein [Maribacter sp. 2-571]|uniref:hypothetical protein n=1 Tax=Maribacter sp. 2-571 TaxID=3417569 RepID=UPI003D348E51